MAVRASVPESRYFTTRAAATDRRCDSANAPDAARTPETTTAPAGMASTPSTGRMIRACTRSYTGVEAASTTPAASTAPCPMRTPSYTPQLPPMNASSSTITGSAPTGSSTPPIWAAADTCTWRPTWAHEPTRA